MFSEVTLIVPVAFLIKSALIPVGIARLLALHAVLITGIADAC